VLTLNWLLLLTSLLSTAALHAQPQLSRIVVTSDGTATLTGSNFGQPCRQCEVVVDYAKGLRYAVPLLDWSDRKIKVELPDLNQGIDLKAVVVTPKGMSSTKRLKLTRQILPSREFTKPVKVVNRSELLVFEKSYQESFGGKGEDQFKLSVNPPICQKTSLVFEKARLVYGDKRFAEAQITELPSAGCIRCKPLQVTWYHEPTGRLTYQLHIYRRAIEGICKGRIRH
jgi:hypothetical protein